MAAAVSATVNIANFVVGQTVDKEKDSAMLTRLVELSQKNRVLGAVTHEKIVADSPMVECLKETAGQGDNACAAGLSYVFFERKSQGKSSAARLFCLKNCRNAKCRSLLIAASGTGETYFERVAADLDVDYTSNWARCLVSAMTKSPEEKFHPFLFLDEFNKGTERDLQNMDTFMRACQNQGFYLIIITSDKKIADDLIGLNAWAKMRPLRYIHNGPIENIKGQPGYDENKTADWKEVDWSINQLKNLVITMEGELDDYNFILTSMTPTDALEGARRRKNQQEDKSALVAATSNVSAGDYGY